MKMTITSDELLPFHTGIVLLFIATMKAEQKLILTKYIKDGFQKKEQ